MSSTRLQQLFSFLKDSPSDSFLLFAIAKEYEGLGESGKAMDYYEQLRTNHPDYVGTYYHLGKLLVAKGQEKQAIQVYREGMETAKRQGDKHALSELAGAKLEIDDED